MRFLQIAALLLPTFLFAAAVAAEEKSRVPVRPPEKEKPALPQLPDPGKKAAAKPPADPPAKPAAKTGAKPPAPPQTPKVEWKQVYHKGRPYLPLEQVAMSYDMPAPKVSGDRIVMENKAFRVEMTRGERKAQLNGWTFYFSYSPVSRYGKTIISIFDVRNVLDPIMHPNTRRDPAVLKTVVIDPSGGGKEEGIKSPYIAEKDLTLDVALQLREKLTAAGFNVVLTRSDDSLVTAAARHKTVDDISGEAIFISLHASSSSGNTRGFETSTLPPAGTPATNESDASDSDDIRLFPGNINDRESLALAIVLQSSSVTKLKTPDLGVKRFRFGELRDINLPAVVCRLGYLSHREEAQQLASAEHRALIAQSLSEGVQRYARYLSHDIEQRIAEDKKRLLSFGSITSVSTLENAGIKGEKTVLDVPLTAAPGATLDRSKVEVQLYLFEQQDDGRIDVTTADAPTIEWVSVLPDWKQSPTENLRATWVRPPFGNAETKEYGKRKYYGYVARLIYDGKVLDESASPQNLNRCLYYFTNVFPRR